MYCISILINSFTMEQFLRRIALMKIVFCSEWASTNVTDAIGQLNREFEMLGSASNDDN